LHDYTSYEYHYCVLNFHQVFRTSAFDVDQAHVDEWLKATHVTISDALGSPARRRVSIKGRVTHVCYLKYFYNYCCLTTVTQGLFV